MLAILLALAGCALEEEPRVVVGADQAIESVLGMRVDRPADGASLGDAELVMYREPAMPEARLAWHVVVEGEAPHTYRAYVDAETGVIYGREDLTRRAPQHRARVYALNPDESELEEVVFSALPEGARTLDDGEIRMSNCIDRRTCQPVLTSAGVRNVHHCELVATATTGDDGSFLHIERADDHAPEDAFAEVQAYAHVRRALGAFRGFFGDETFRLRAPLDVIVNMRPPDLRNEVSICEGDVAPRGSRLRIEDNAYFWPAGGLGPTAVGDRVVLHQASNSDWAYDGEVVFHEFTHAVMNTTTPLAWRHLDARGLDVEGGALHEALSDYFAGAISGNAELSTYAGRSESGPAPTNTLATDVRCDDVLDGEEHSEGEAFAGALWASRRAMRSAEKRAMFDAAVARVIRELGQHDGFAEAYALLIRELDRESEALITRKRFGEREAEALRGLVARVPEHFADRGLPDCGGRSQELALGDTKSDLYLYGPNGFGVAQYGEQMIPATMQIAIDVPFETDAIQIHAESGYAYDDTLPSPEMKAAPEIFALIKRDEAITWTWSLPHGDHDAEMVGELSVDGSGETAGVLEGHFEPGRYYVQLANRGADWVLGDISVLVRDPEGNFVDGKEDRAGDAAASPGATGCNAGGARGSWLWLLGVIAVVRRKRR